MIRIIGLVLVLLLTGCDSQFALAPVENATMHGEIRPGVYQVGSGETLYSIAWRYGLDYRVLAQMNDISPPYKIEVGERLQLHAPIRRTVLVPLQKTKAMPVQQKQPIKLAPIHLHPAVKHHPNKFQPAPAATTHISRWLWPTHGRLLAGFSTNNPGIDIAGKLGQPIMTTAPGVVVYAGNGLHGYGNLLIIKHNDEYLTAYAHNSQLLVKENDIVKAGQVIAKMGKSGATRVKLHFEMRKAGKPVNPLRYLKKQ